MIAWGELNAGSSDAADGAWGTALFSCPRLVRTRHGELSADADGELDDSWVGDGAGDGAEGCGAEGAVGLGELGGVEDVEDFCAEFHVGFSGQIGVLGEREVQIAIGGAAGGIARGGADNELWRGGEGRRC